MKNQSQIIKWMGWLLMASQSIPLEGTWICIQKDDYTIQPSHHQIVEKWNTPLGASVLLLQDSRLSSTSLCFSIQTGILHETVPGISSLAQELLLKQTSEQETELQKLMSQAKGIFNFHTLIDQTLFMFSFQGMEKNILSHLQHLFQDVITSEKELILNKNFIQKRVRQNEETPFQEAFKKTLEIACPSLASSLLTENFPRLKLPARQVQEWIQEFYYTSRVTACLMTNQPLEEVRELVLDLVKLLRKKPLEPKTFSAWEEQIDRPKLIYLNDNTSLIRITWLFPATHQFFLQRPEQILGEILFRKHASSLKDILLQQNLIEDIQIESQIFSHQLPRFFHLDLIPTQKGLLNWQEMVQTCIESFQQMFLAPAFPQLYKQWISKHKTYFLSFLPNLGSMEQTIEWATLLHIEPMTTFPKKYEPPVETVEKASETLCKLFQSPYLVTLSCPLDIWNIFRVQNGWQPFEESELSFLSSYDLTYRHENIDYLSPSTLSKTTYPFPALPIQEDEKIKNIDLEMFLPPTKKAGKMLWEVKEKLPQDKGQATCLLKVNTHFPSNDLKGQAISLLVNMILEGRMEVLGNEINLAGGFMQCIRNNLFEKTFVISYWKNYFPKMLQMLREKLTLPLEIEDQWLFLESKKKQIAMIRASMDQQPLFLILEKLHQVIFDISYEKKDLKRALLSIEWNNLLGILPSSFYNMEKATFYGASQSLFDLFSDSSSIKTAFTDPYRKIHFCVSTQPVQSAAIAFDCGLSNDPLLKSKISIGSLFLNIFLAQTQNAKQKNKGYCISCDIGGRSFLILLEESDYLSSSSLHDELLNFIQGFGTLIPEHINEKDLTFVKNHIMQTIDECPSTSLFLSDLQNERENNCFFWNKAKEQIQKETKESLVSFLHSVLDFGQRRFITILLGKNP